MRRADEAVNGPTKAAHGGASVRTAPRIWSGTMPAPLLRSMAELGVPGDVVARVAGDNNRAAVKRTGHHGR